MSRFPQTIKGRGTSANPVNRFEPLEVEIDPEDAPPSGLPKTQYFLDASKTIIARNSSPDVGFDASINPYRGCEHGCVYCYARPTHEYAGLSSGLDFETKIFVKKNAPELLRRELSSRSWKPEPLAISGVTDCYQPVERKLQITRECLKVLADFRNPAVLITKNRLITRDIDVLERLNRHRAVSVAISVTSLDPKLTRILEPRASLPEQRLEALRALRAAGIPAGVLVAPVIPAINEHEIPAILKAAAQADAHSAGYVLMRLPYAVKHLFDDWLKRHFPDRRLKVLHRLESLRGGRLNDPNFHSRMRGEGIFAKQIEDLFRLSRKKAGLNGRRVELSTDSFRVPGELPLFERD